VDSRRDVGWGAEADEISLANDLSSLGRAVQRLSLPLQVAFSWLKEVNFRLRLP
jgi:hypothetical protein